MAAKSARKLSVSDLFDVNFFAFAVLTMVAGAACYAIIGADAFWGSFESDLELFLIVLPRFMAAMFLAAFVQVLLPRDKIARYLSDRAGFSCVVGYNAGRIGDAWRSDDVVSACASIGEGGDGAECAHHLSHGVVDKRFSENNQLGIAAAWFLSLQLSGMPARFLWRSLLG